MLTPMMNLIDRALMQVVVVLAALPVLALMAGGLSH